MTDFATEDDTNERLRILPIDGREESGFGFLRRAGEGPDDAGHWLGGTNGRVWVDSFGREVEVPGSVERVAPAQSLAHEIVDALGRRYVATEPPHPPNVIRNRARMTALVPAVPRTGLLGYGDLSDEDVRALREAGAQLVVSVERSDRALPSGAPARAGAGTSPHALDRLQGQAGIPVVGFDARFSFAEVFRALGELLGCGERARELAAFMEESDRLLLEHIANVAEPELKRIVFFGNSPVGNAVDNFHGKLFRLLGVEPFGMLDLKGGERREVGIDFCKVRAIDPDAVVFLDSASSHLSHREIQTSSRAGEWLALDAIQERRFYDAPDGCLGWPPLMAQAVGAPWLVWRVLGGLPDFDLTAHAARFANLFFGPGIPDQQIAKMVSAPQYATWGEYDEALAAALSVCDDLEAAAWAEGLAAESAGMLALGQLRTALDDVKRMRATGNPVPYSNRLVVAGRIVDVKHMLPQRMSGMITYDLSDVGLRYFDSDFARSDFDGAG